MNRIVPDDGVWAIASSAERVYLGGDFDWLGPRTGHFVVFRRGSTNRETRFPEVAGALARVDAIAPDGVGGWFLGGRFESLGGLDCPNLAHVRADGSVDRNWCPHPNEDVLALARAGNRLYLGGRFSAVRDRLREGLAVVDARSGVLLPWNPGRGVVRAMAIAGRTVFVGGNFTEIGGRPRAYIAAVDAFTGKATPWNARSERSKLVRAITVSPSTVYVAGDFTRIGGARRHGLAALDRRTAQATTWNPRPTGFADALAFAEGTVYANGFRRGTRGDGLAAIDARTGRKHWAVRTDSSVSGIARLGRTLYVVGWFHRLARAPREHVAALDAHTGRLLRWRPNLGSGADTVAVSGRRIAVGGSFSSVGTIRRRCAAAVDAVTGEPSAWDPRIGGCTLLGVRAMAATDSTVYLAGNFRSVGGVARVGFAAVDAGTARVKPWYPGPASDHCLIPRCDIAVADGIVYVTGDFERIGGLPRHGVAALDAETGTVSSWNPLLPETPEAVEVAAGTVYLGGRRFLTSVDASTGQPRSWTPSLDGDVNEIVVAGNWLYVAGGFNRIAGVARPGIARFSLASGAIDAWNPRPSLPGPNSPFRSVNSIAVDAGVVYLQGNFSRLGDVPRRGMGAADTETAAALPWAPTIPNGEAGTAGIRLAGGHVWLGGLFYGHLAALEPPP